MIHPSALRAAHLRESLPGHDRAARLRASREHAHHDPRAERVAAEIVVVVAEPQMLDERQSVVGEHVRRKGGRVARFRAVPMAAEVRKDYEVPLSGERAWPGRSSSMCEPLPRKPCSRISGRPDPV